MAGLDEGVRKSGQERLHDFRPSEWEEVVKTGSERSWFGVGVKIRNLVAGPVMCPIPVQHPDGTFKEAAVCSSLGFRGQDKQETVCSCGWKLGMDKIQEAEEVTKDSFPGREG